MTTVTDRVMSLSTTMLPLDEARSLLLPPVRLARQGAVAVARTVRHWELALGGDATDEGDDIGSTPPVTSAADLPVPEWPEMAFADAQASLSRLETVDLRTLLDYEKEHGRRTEYVLLLEHRLSPDS